MDFYLSVLRYETRKVMEKLIQNMARAMENNWTLESIHDLCIKKGWSEDHFFLAWKAAENLYQARQLK
jgi:hypothetical protein